MKVNKSIIKTHNGYQLQGYAKSYKLPVEIRTLYKRLKRIPCKISSFIDRKTIKEAYRFDEYTYFIIDTNNEVFILDY